MGNQIKSAKLLLPPDVYAEKLMAIAEQRENIDNKQIQIFSGAGDVHVLQIILIYCERREQVRILEAVTNTRRNTILSNINTSPYADVYAIAAFNKKNGVFDAVPGARELMFKLFFTNLVVKGKKKNIEYLLSNKNNFTLAFLHYIAIRKGDILSAKTENEEIEIDLLVEKFKEDKKKEFSFNFDDIFTSDDDKLNDIKYKNAYKFEKFDREIDSDIVDIKCINWRLLNDTFLRYLVTNQLNFCFDDEQSKHKGINDNINLKDLDILSGSSLINCPLSGYMMNSTSTKHKTFKMGRGMGSNRIEKKISMTTNKLSSVFLIRESLNKHNKDKNEDDMIETSIMVLTARNPSSQDHIKEKSKFGTSNIYSVLGSIDNAMGGKRNTYQWYH